MKKQLTIFTLLFTVAFTSISYAEWTKVTTNVKGDALYVDFEKIMKKDGYIYWWYLVDYIKPIKHGIWSLRAYIQGDCKQFRYKIFSDFPHKKSMGKGTASKSSNKPDKKWRYAPLNSSTEYLLNAVCKHEKNNL